MVLNGETELLFSLIIQQVLHACVLWGHYKQQAVRCSPARF